MNQEVYKRPNGDFEVKRDLQMVDTELATGTPPRYCGIPEPEVQCPEKQETKCWKCEFRDKDRYAEWRSGLTSASAHDLLMES